MLLSLSDFYAAKLHLYTPQPVRRRSFNKTKTNPGEKIMQPIPSYRVGNHAKINAKTENLRLTPCEIESPRFAVISIPHQTIIDDVERTPYDV